MEDLLRWRHAKAIRSKTLARARCRAGASGSELNPEIWSRLPYEFVCFILERVPTDSLMRWRRVSKSWVHDFLLSKSTILKWLSPKGETIPMFHLPIETFSDSVQTNSATRKISFTVSTFNKYQNTWQDLKVSLHEHPRAVVFHDSRLFTTGGIVLLDLTFFNLNNMKETSMTVFNPTTGKCRHLPPAPDAMARPIGMIKPRDARSYSVVAAGCTLDEQKSRLFVFNSESNEWRFCGTTTERITMIPSDSAVSIGNVLYYLVERLGRTQQSKRWDLLAFDVSTETCQDLGTAPKHYGGGKPALLDIGGDLVYVARVTWIEGKARQSTWWFHHFDPEEQEWVKGSSMPTVVHEQMTDQIYKRTLKVSGAGNFIYFYGAPGSVQAPPRVLAHNHSDNSWYWLPDITSSVGLMHAMPLLKNYFLVSLEPSLMPV